MTPIKIVITVNSRGQIVVRILSWGGSILDEASFVSIADALAWAGEHIPDLERSP